MTPATGRRQGGGPGLHPNPTPGSAATPAPRLTVQFLPGDAAAAARVAAAGGNPHLELECKCVVTPTWARLACPLLCRVAQGVAECWGCPICQRLAFDFTWLYRLLVEA